jgi:hypothetical protein
VRARWGGGTRWRKGRISRAKELDELLGRLDPAARADILEQID